MQDFFFSTSITSIQQKYHFQGIGKGIFHIFPIGGPYKAIFGSPDLPQDTKIQRKLSL